MRSFQYKVQPRTPFPSRDPLSPWGNAAPPRLFYPLSPWGALSSSPPLPLGSTFFFIPSPLGGEGRVRGVGRSSPAVVWRARNLEPTEGHPAAPARWSHPLYRSGEVLQGRFPPPALHLAEGPATPAVNESQCATGGLPTSVASSRLGEPSLHPLSPQRGEAGLPAFLTPLPPAGGEGTGKGGASRRHFFIPSPLAEPFLLHSLSPWGRGPG